VDSTLISFVALLCAGLCCLLAAAGIVGTIWFLMRGSSTGAAEQDPYSGRALATTPPEVRRPRREPAAETAILPTPPPAVGSVRVVSGEEDFPDDEMETVVANPPASPPQALPPRPPGIEMPRLPPVLGETPAEPSDAATPEGKKAPKSSGQTIIAFDDDDEDW
jgi:hypothetical protein